MKKFVTATIFALSMSASGIAIAQTSPSTTAPSATPSTPSVTTPAAPPAAVKPATGAPTATAPAKTAPVVAMDPAAEAKFKAADKSGKGVIEGAALEPYKPDLAKIDTDKDGKISRAEFAAAHKAGVIK